MSTAINLLQQARESGYTLTVNGEKLKVRPVPPDGLLNEIRAHKAELLALLTTFSANDSVLIPLPVESTVTARQTTFLGRTPLVDEAELHGIQHTLMLHVIKCQVCNLGHHAYCPDGERIGLGYWAFLFEFQDGDVRHRDYMTAVALARSAGLKAGFSALLRMYSFDGGNRLESHLGAAWLAFDEHTATCTSCLRRAGWYCGEGHMLRNAAMLEREQ